MPQPEIHDHATLLLRIAELRVSKAMQDEDVKRKFQGFLTTLDPVTIVKSTLHDLAADTDVKHDIAKAALNIGADFLIYQIFGKKKGLKGFLSAMLVEKISTTLINNHIPDILSGIGKIVGENKVGETNY